MKKKLKLSKYKACLCEGEAETAIMEILLDNNLLIFSKEELIDEEIIRCRKAEDFKNQYLNKRYDDKISIIRVLDRENEKFEIKNAVNDLLVCPDFCYQKCP